MSNRSIVLRLLSDMGFTHGWGDPTIDLTKGHLIFSVETRVSLKTLPNLNLTPPDGRELRLMEIDMDRKDAILSAVMEV